MNIILLSGGSGKRLWPLSNEVRSKQFLKIFRRDDGSHESMVQRVYRMIKEVSSEVTITFATSENQVASIKMQLDENIDISIEPCRRDTFPAIALATSYLYDIKGLDESEPVVVCPVDTYVEEGYFEALQKLSDLAEHGDSNLTLLGIDPTYPSGKYGYIFPETKDSLSRVLCFKEKPTMEKASEYLKQGALWNAGIFAFKLGYLREKARTLIGTSIYQELFDSYSDLKKISFDYAVVEKEPSINVLRFQGEWKDLGTWNTLTEAMSDTVLGNAVAGKCSNTHVIKELQIPLIALGCKNMAIAATHDGILVTDKDTSYELKDYVKDARPMSERREWGEYHVLDYQNGNSLTKHIWVRENMHISYHKHMKRAEYWIITDGKGTVILNDVKKDIIRGDTVFIPAGMKHTVMAVTNLSIIEVWMGDELLEEDIERFEYNWAEVCCDLALHTKI